MKRRFVDVFICIYVSICIQYVQWLYRVCVEVRFPASDNYTPVKQVTSFALIKFSFKMFVKMMVAGYPELTCTLHSVHK